MSINYEIKVFGIMEVFDFDSSIEVAFLGLVTLLLVALIQISLKQSFTPGEVRIRQFDFI